MCVMLIARPFAVRQIIVVSVLPLYRLRRWREGTGKAGNLIARCGRALRSGVVDIAKQCAEFTRKAIRCDYVLDAGGSQRRKQHRRIFARDSN